MDELSRNLALMGGEERKKKKVVIEGGCEARGKITETWASDPKMEKASSTHRFSE